MTTTDVELLTAYRVAKVINAVLEAKELTPVNEQLVYRYLDQGLIEFVETDAGKRIRSDVAITFARKFVAAREAKTSVNDELIAAVLGEDDETNAA